MRWAIQGSSRSALLKWHLKFAWWPIRLPQQGTVVWLEEVQRRGTLHSLANGRHYWYTWEYRLVDR